jgi:hypothetical protein
LKYPKINLTMTTFNRLKLFRETMESFFECCKDQDLITRYIISDDGSSEEDIQRMMKEYPFMEFYRNPKNGQASNINNLFSKVDTEFWFHCEDDWLFLQKGNFIREMLEIAFDDPLIKNVTLREWSGNIVKSHKTLGLEYNLHKFAPSADYELVKKTNCSWYGYSLFGLQHLPTVKMLGPYDEEFNVSSRHWDRPQAFKYMLKGFKVANISHTQYVKHIGGDFSAYYFRLKGR